MPRQNRRRPDEPRAGAPRAGGGGASGDRSESFRGEQYVVRSVTGSAAGKTYRCPGCDQVVAGVPHVVAWPAHDEQAGDRRHWHTPCWSARERRAPGIQRTRNAPRY